MQNKQTITSRENCTSSNSTWRKLLSLQGLSCELCSYSNISLLWQLSPSPTIGKVVEFQPWLSFSQAMFHMSFEGRYKSSLQCIQNFTFVHLFLPEIEFLSLNPMRGILLLKVNVQTSCGSMYFILILFSTEKTQHSWNIKYAYVLRYELCYCN